jgi:membrane fusion protein (multidrug efflux system)
VALLSALLIACGDDRPAAPAAAAPPPPEVGVVAVAPTTVSLATELPGRVEASRTAQVRSRVTGIVQKRLFREGSDVKAGQVLFQIDPAPYQALVDSARASLARAEANVTQTAAQVKRYEPLRQARAISEQEYVNAAAALAQARADVAAAQAALRTAQLNFGYASVTAPISGRIGRALVTEGALVSQAEATQLALIQQIDPVYVNFAQPISELQRLRQAMERGRATAVEEVPVRILFDDGSELAQPGRLLFSDLSVDATSGQVTLRAEVPNPDGILLPGLYVRGRLAQAQVRDAMLVPQQAVTRTDRGDSVFVVGPDGKAVQREVRISGAQGNQWIVLAGLSAGEQVVVDGFQKMQPGGTVRPVPWQGLPGGGAAVASSAGSRQSVAPAGAASSAQPRVVPAVAASAPAQPASR